MLGNNDESKNNPTSFGYIDKFYSQEKRERLQSGFDNLNFNLNYSTQLISDVELDENDTTLNVIKKGKFSKGKAPSKFQSIITRQKKIETQSDVLFRPFSFFTFF
jgi:hypothetical protein